MSSDYIKIKRTCEKRNDYVNVCIFDEFGWVSQNTIWQFGTSTFFKGTSLFSQLQRNSFFGWPSEIKWDNTKNSLHKIDKDATYTDCYDGVGKKDPYWSRDYDKSCREFLDCVLKEESKTEVKSK